jgi:hypothetical protein
MRSSDLPTLSLFTTPLLALFMMIMCGCNSTSSFSSGSSNPTQEGSTAGTNTIVSAGGNVMSITVNGSLCGSQQYANEPCVSVTLCAPGGANCQTIDNILLDTGSYGLRIFQSLITVPLTPIASGTGEVAECVGFGDGSSEWGQVESASLKLAGEPAVAVPILAINSTYATPPAACTSAQSTPDTSPDEAGFNGILGVGVFAQDCGAYCAQTASNGVYFTCSGSTCTPAAVATSNQVANPVSLLPRDNNGVIVELPQISANGAPSVTGSLVLGIGTTTNNIPSDVTMYAANTQAQFTAVFASYSSAAIPSFIDSGSSILFIPAPSGGQLPDCSTAAGGSHGTDYQGFDCPSSSLTFSAMNYGASGSATGNVSFSVANAYTLYQSGNSVFMNMAGSGGTGANAIFDWGLPFFFGRNVYVGIENSSSSLGTGSYWAY